MTEPTPVSRDVLDRLRRGEHVDVDELEEEPVVTRSLKKKTRAHYFELVLEGKKTFEVRALADHEVALLEAGALLQLLEVDDRGVLTGRELLARVPYVLGGDELRDLIGDVWHPRVYVLSHGMVTPC